MSYPPKGSVMVALKVMLSSDWKKAGSPSVSLRARIWLTAMRVTAGTATRLGKSSLPQAIRFVTVALLSKTRTTSSRDPDSTVTAGEMSASTVYSEKCEVTKSWVSLLAASPSSRIVVTAPSL